jgi:hypothetical protein
MTHNLHLVQQSGMPKEESDLFQSQKGRILRVKQGYNPNSSSMGSEVFSIFILPTALLTATVGFGAVSSLILSGFMHPGDRHNGQSKSVLENRGANNQQERVS